MRVKLRYIILQENSKLPAGRWKRQALSRAEAESAGGNIGLKTGRGLLVVDVDVKHGNAGMAAWQDLCRQHGYEPPAPLVRTPTGGWHIYFSAPRSRRLAGHVGILPGVDLRGDGNYVVVPPSRTEAGEYSYVDPGRTEVGPHPPAPRWLLDLARPGRKQGPRKPGMGSALDLPAEAEPASTEEVEAALRALERRWPEMPWRAIWAGEEMTQDRHGAVRTASQRDQMLAYRLAAVGYSPEAIVRLMSACPAVRAKRRGKQPDAWTRASYRQATIQAAVELVAQHRAAGAVAAPGAEAGDDAIGQALEKLRTAPGWEIWAAQAIIVRRRAAKDGQPSARITRRIWLDRLRAAGVAISERQYRQVWDARRNPLLEASEDAAGYWWFRLREAEILEAVGRVGSTSPSAAPASAAGRSGGRVGSTSSITTTTHIRVYSRSTPPPNGNRSARKTSRKNTIIAKVKALLSEGKRPAEIAKTLAISRTAARQYAYRLRQREKAAEAAAKACQPEQPAEAVDVFWTLTPARRILSACYIPPGALTDPRRRKAWVRAADRIDCYAQAVQAPAGWENLPYFQPLQGVKIGPQDAAQQVIRVIGNWLRYTPPPDWLPEHRQAIREWMAGEVRRHQEMLDRMARKSGARRYRCRISEALLLEKALAALNLRHMWLPGFWIARRDYRRTADKYQAFRELWATIRTDAYYQVDPADTEFLKSQTVPRSPEVIFVTDAEMDSDEPPEVQPPGVLHITFCPAVVADFEEEVECQPAK